MDLNKLLKIMVDKKASDLYFKVGNVPHIRVNGELQPVGKESISSKDMDEAANIILESQKRASIAEKDEIDTSYTAPELGRFRVNIFTQRGYTGIVIRSLKTEILGFRELNLPVDIMQKLSMRKRGLILITGHAGSGKSTTLAAIIEYMSANRRAHIITIEDPIEFIHEDNKSIIEQREIGIDTKGFKSALRYVVRQSPDVILIGEIRDTETMETAIMAAETGHLVLSTLHTIDAIQTVERIINFFPPYQHRQIRMQLSFILKGVISMRLLPLASGEGRIPALEIMLASPTIRKLLLEGQTGKIYDTIKNSKDFGMQTFNQSVEQFYKDGLISYEDALSASDSQAEFRLRTKGIFSTSRTLKDV